MAFKLYFGFGLNIYSNYCWDGLIPIQSIIPEYETITINVDKVKKFAGKGRNPGDKEIKVEKEGATITYKNKSLGTLKAMNGLKLEFNPPQRLKENLKRNLLKWGIATLLHQRGTIVLSGTHILINGKGILITGHEEERAVLLEACLSSGGKLIADQMAAISFIEDDPCIVPCYPGNFSPEDPAVSLSNPEGLLFVKNIPLNCIYYLNPEAENEPCLVSKFDAFKKIFPQFYLNISGYQDKMMTTHFRNIERLLNKVQVFEVKPPRQEPGKDKLIERFISI